MAGKTRVWKQLIEDQNSTYVYDPLTRNCTTRLVELLEIGMGQSVDDMAGSSPEGSYRSLLRSILEDTNSTPPTTLLYGALLGTKGDLKLGLRERLFVPSLLREFVSEMLRAKPIALAPPFSLAARAKDASLWGWLVGGVIGLFVLAMALPRFGIALIGLGLGCSGALLWAIIFMSDSPWLWPNWGVLVLAPTDLILCLTVGSPSRRRIAAIGYIALRLLGLCFSLLTMAPEMVPIQLIVLSLLLLVATLLWKTVGFCQAK